MYKRDFTITTNSGDFIEYQEDTSRPYKNYRRILLNGHKVANYYWINRTWERWDYNTIEWDLVEKLNMPESKREELKEILKNGYSIDFRKELKQL